MKGRKRGIDLDGILLLDKPSGLSSNQALQRAKRLFDAAKAGHTGSLDPLASGLLPICFGQATRLAEFLLDSHKEYRVGIRLGVKTATGDAEGEVLAERSVPELSFEELQVILRTFVGTISQVPPMYSALKHQGHRLYELARKGIEVDRSARTIRIDRLDVLEHSRERLNLQVSCSKGTYIRTLAEDIGEAIGCGAHVENLRRTGVGRFRIERCWTFEQLQLLSAGQLAQCLLPIDAAVANWPRLEFAQESVQQLNQGRVLDAHDAPAGGWVRMYAQDRFFGIAEVLPDHRIAPRKIFAIESTP